MDKFDPLFDNQFIYALGWTIVHSFWQSLLVLVLLSVGLLLNKHSRPETRYWLSMAALCCCLISSIKTFIYCYQDVAQASLLFAQIQTSVADAQIQTWWVITFKTINPWLDTIVLLWCIGLAIQTLRLTSDIILTQRLKHQSTSPLPNEWERRLQALANTLNINRKVQFLQSTKVAIPSVIGHFKPVVLMPLGILTQLPPEQVEAIILHELAHVKRHDYLVNIAQCLIKVMFFFNPFVLAISKKINIERENVCDDLAVKACGDPIIFAHSLSQFADVTTYSQTAMAASNDKYYLLARVKRLFSKQQTLSINTERLISLLCIAMLGFPLTAKENNQPLLTLEQKLVDKIEQPMSEEFTNDIKTLETQTPESRQPVKTQKSNLEENYGKNIQLETLIVVIDQDLKSIDYMPPLESKSNSESTSLVNTVSEPAINYLEQDELKPGINEEQDTINLSVEATHPNTQKKESIYSVLSNRTFKHFIFKSKGLNNKKYVIFPPFTTRDMSLISRDKKWKYQSQSYLSKQDKAPVIFLPLESVKKVKINLSETDVNTSLIAHVSINKVLLEFTHRKYFTGFDRTPVTHKAHDIIGPLNNGTELPSADNLNVYGQVILNKPNRKSGTVLGIEIAILLSDAKSGELVGQSTQKVYFQSNRLNQEKFKQIKKGFENDWALIGPPLSATQNKTRSETINQWKALTYSIQEQIRDAIIEAKTIAL